MVESIVCLKGNRMKVISICLLVSERTVLSVSSDFTGKKKTGYDWRLASVLSSSN